MANVHCRERLRRAVAFEKLNGRALPSAYRRKRIRTGLLKLKGSVFRGNFLRRTVAMRRCVTIRSHSAPDSRFVMVTVLPAANGNDFGNLGSSRCVAALAAASVER